MTDSSDILPHLLKTKYRETLLYDITVARETDNCNII